MGNRTRNTAAHEIAPRTSAAISATRAAGFYVGHEYVVLIELCLTLERENGLLRTALANAADAASQLHRIPLDERITADMVARGWLQTPNVQGEGAPERSGGNPQAPLAGAPSRQEG